MGVSALPVVLYNSVRSCLEMLYHTLCIGKEVLLVSHYLKQFQRNAINAIYCENMPLHYPSICIDVLSSIGIQHNDIHNDIHNDMAPRAI